MIVHLVMSLLLGCSTSSLASGSLEPIDPREKFPEGLEKELQKPLVRLGQALFFDKRMSANGKVACSTCHSPNYGFSDSKPLSKGLHGKKTKRHAPHLLNLAWGRLMFWDGRARSLEDQVLQPIQDPVEMGHDLSNLEEDLGKIPFYQRAFALTFSDEKISSQRIAMALTAFVSSLVSHDSPYDRYLRGNSKAISVSAKRGLALFSGKGQCITCHFGPNLTDSEFHFTGVVGDDPGRGALDRNGRKEFDMTPYPFFASKRAFKTPGLRNVAQTAPYMHNGSEPTLEDVLELYDLGGRHEDKSGLARGIQPLGLTPQDKKDLVSFLKTLTGKINFHPNPKGWEKGEKP